jgi:hypothetical protein
LQEQVPEYLLLKADGTTDDATATVPTVLLTTATDTADGIMDMTMYTAVSSVVIKAAAVWTKEMCYVWTKEKGSGAYI